MHRGVSQSWPGGLLQSWPGRVPQSRMGDMQVLAILGHPSPARARWTIPWPAHPPAKTGWSTPGQVRMGYPQPELGYSLNGLGYPRDRTAERILALQWTVCLLQSCRTFLLPVSSWHCVPLPARTRVPPPQPGLGYSPGQDWGYPPAMTAIPSQP